MGLYIYNSLTRKKEEFIPINPPRVNIYTCGVTVYDESHIGHARSLYIFDVMRRYLKYRGFEVNFVRNITDIDDKIINRANEQKAPWNDLVEKYIGRYYEDLEALGIQKGDAEPRATENIADMVKCIEVLIEKGFAYEAGGDVYFNVRKFSRYGELSGQGIDQMESGVRIEPAGHKKDPLDFALWKKSKPNEPSWLSPWSEGRPGWHIECSVMSQKFLKTDTLDIHAGGRDLIFPHHENEIAQAQARTGKPFAKYWVHHGLLTINGQKMAKSLGNFVTIGDFLAKYHPSVLKLFFLQAHYSQPIDFSWAAMEDKRSALERIMIFLGMVKKRQGAQGSFTQTNLKRILSPVELENAVNDYRDFFIKAMDDDFNTPNALAALFEIVNVCNKVLYDASYKEAYAPILQYAVKSIEELADVLEISFEATTSVMSVAQIEDYIKKRQDFKKKKMFKEADRIRDDLEAKGIILEDSKGTKTTWRRKL